MTDRDTSCGPEEAEFLRRAIDEAFDRFGASALWSCRRPPVATPAAADAVGRLLRRQGGRDAFVLGQRLQSLAETVGRSL
jgi:hypothetical protein